MAMCTSRKSTRRFARRKGSVRAECWPPKMITNVGTADVMAGDIARPVRILKGKSKKTTAR
jgi:hypothetical protein